MHSMTAHDRKYSKILNCPPSGPSQSDHSPLLITLTVAVMSTITNVMMLFGDDDSDDGDDDDVVVLRIGSDGAKWKAK